MEKCKVIKCDGKGGCSGYCTKCRKDLLRIKEHNKQKEKEEKENETKN